MFSYCVYNSKVIIVRMACCSDETVDKNGETRLKFKQKKQSQPLKFKFLSMLGLKQYIVDKYVFSRSQPKYQLFYENGYYSLKTQKQIDYPSGYRVGINLIQYQNHRIPFAILQLKDKSLVEGTIIYSHGNSSDLSYALRFISKLAGNQPRYNYVAYDYTGYGTESKGDKITQQTICEDLQILISYLKLQNEEIILWGFSLGTYPTAKIASRRKVKGVILQSPLASIYSLYTEDLSLNSVFNQNDCFSLLNCISEISSFLLLIHSKQDQIIPFLHSKVLFEKYQTLNSNPFCFLLQVSNIKHNELHLLITDTNDNQIRRAIHKHLSLMGDSGNIPKAKIFQLKKVKYFQNLGDMKSAEFIQLSDKVMRIKSENQGIMNAHQSADFSRLKEKHEFELDEVTNEISVDNNIPVQVKIFRHGSYFVASGEAIEETEVSQILAESKLQQFLN